MKKLLILCFVFGLAVAQGGDKVSTANALQGALSGYFGQSSFQVGHVPDVGFIVYGTVSYLGEADPQEVIDGVQHMVGNMLGLFAGDDVVVFIRAAAAPWGDTGVRDFRHFAFRFVPDMQVWLDGEPY